MEPVMQNDARMPGAAERQFRTWAGHGSGAMCNGCGSPIKTTEIEYEIEMPRDGYVTSLRFHFACYRVWSTQTADSVAV